MSSLISYLHCLPTRPVNSMVGISVGFHNVYSMLTGHCRLDKITLHGIHNHTSIFVSKFTHIFINLLSFGHFPDHSSPFATTLRFWVWKIIFYLLRITQVWERIFYLLTNHLGLGEDGGDEGGGAGQEDQGCQGGIWWCWILNRQLGTL